MRKLEMAKRMARQAGVTEGEAADRLDGVVRHILSALRKSGEADLPGLGRFTRGSDGTVRFERSGRDD